MDWSSYMLGVMTGALTVMAALGILAWRWSAPFMKAAQQRAQHKTPQDETTNSFRGEVSAEAWAQNLAGRRARKNGGG